MDPSFGARLRAQREEKQIELSAISVETKIKASMLEALERDDISQWPEGIFRRAYVRAYARAVGLDPETLVREFLEAHPDPVVTPPETPSTELEEPEWPAGLHRFVRTARAAIPSRRQRVASALPVETVVDNSRVGPEEPLPFVGDDDRPAIDEFVESERSFSANDHSVRENADHSPGISLLDAAELCTRLGRVMDRREVAPILEDAAMVLGAVGLIVWRWDSRMAVLKPSIAYGYTDAVLAQMRTVRSDADNALADAFQSARACVVNGSDEATGAVVVPLIAHRGCVGVLAVELQRGDEQREDVLAFATILAAQLSTIVGSAPLAKAVSA